MTTQSTVSINNIKVNVNSQFYTDKETRRAAAALTLALSGQGTFTGYVSELLFTKDIAELPQENLSTMQNFCNAVIAEARHNKALELGFTSFDKLVADDSTIDAEDLPLTPKGKPLTQAQFKARLKGLNVGEKQQNKRYAVIKSTVSRQGYGLSFDSDTGLFVVKAKEAKADDNTAADKILASILKLDDIQLQKLANLLETSEEGNAVRLSSEITRQNNASTSHTLHDKLDAQRKASKGAIRAANAAKSRAVQAKDSEAENAARAQFEAASKKLSTIEELKAEVTESDIHGTALSEAFYEELQSLELNEVVDVLGSNCH